MSEVVIPKILRDNLEYNVVSGVFTRCGQELGGVNSKYTTIRYLGKAVKAHVLAWYFCHGKWPTQQLDHKDRNKKNNAIGNLREVNTSQNCHNQFGARRSNKLTGLQGVKVHKRKSGTVAYRASISVCGKDLHLGLFDTPEEAHSAYMKKKVELLNE